MIVVRLEYWLRLCLPPLAELLGVGFGTCLGLFGTLDLILGDVDRPGL